MQCNVDIVCFLYLYSFSTRLNSEIIGLKKDIYFAHLLILLMLFHPNTQRFFKIPCEIQSGF